MASNPEEAADATKVEAAAESKAADSAAFDAAAKEAALLAEASSWDTSAPLPAADGDIPVVDIASWRASGDRTDLVDAASTVRDACENVGFFQLVGHGLEQEEIDAIFDWTRRFHDLPLDVKQRINIDNPDHPLAGVGYLPIGERRLPRRAKGNRNEAFLIKSDKNIASDDNQWPGDEALPGFRAAVEAFAARIERVALDLVPVYAAALGLEPNFFDAAFAPPFWRLRFTHYPPEERSSGDEKFGIAPHVDTSFFTLLLQEGPGLVIWSAARKEWIQAPATPGALMVNTGELLRQWSNDRFLSTRHFADNRERAAHRYSIPLFFNASGDWPMECLPTCTGVGNPPKYPTISYNQSQAVAQGE